MVLDWFTKRERVRRQAARWLARLENSPTAADRAAFTAWYEGDAARAAAYDRLASLWDRAPGVSRARVGAATATPMRRAPGAGRLVPLGLAVAALAALLIAAPWRMLSNAPGAAPELLLLSTDIGEIKPFALADGSRVTLDTNSKARVAFDGRSRTILLERGRARFAVATEPRPFEVRAGGSVLIARGTMFDAGLEPAGLVVWLLDGGLELRRLDRPGVRLATLRAGETLRWRGGSPVIGPLRRNEAVWPAGKLDFDNEPMASAIALANRYSRRPIRLAGADLAALKVTGVYRAGDTLGLARALAAAFRLRVDAEQGNDILLSR